MPMMTFTLLYLCRYSGEKPYVLPVSGNYKQTYEIGAVARYHCNEGYRLHMLYGQDIYR